jgi:hypothetical protein
LLKGTCPIGAGSQTQHMLRVLLEAFWPSRRIFAFDEFCTSAT